MKCHRHAQGPVTPALWERGVWMNVGNSLAECETPEGRRYIVRGSPRGLCSETEDIARKVARTLCDDCGLPKHPRVFRLGRCSCGEAEE